MKRRRWLIGAAITCGFLTISVGYSFSLPDQYQGEVTYRIGRIPNVEAISKVASLTSIGKGVWRLFEKRDTKLIQSQKSIQRSLESSFPNQRNADNNGFIDRTQSEMPDVFRVFIRAGTREGVKNLAFRVTSELEERHSEIFRGYLEKLEENKAVLESLVAELSAVLGSEIKEIEINNPGTPTDVSLGQALAWEMYIRLVEERDRYSLLMIPPNAYPTVQIGEVIVGQEPIEPGFFRHLLAFLIIGLAVGLALPIGLGLLGSARQNL